MSNFPENNKEQQITTGHFVEGLERAHFTALAMVLRLSSLSEMRFEWLIGREYNFFLHLAVPGKQFFENVF